jgi:lactate dehydrogenase-like 2-hydroxyacid dehydrogenase
VSTATGLLKTPNAMSKPKVYVTRRVPNSGLELLQKKCDVKIWDSDDEVPRDTLLEGVAGVNGIFCLITEKIDAELLDAAGEIFNILQGDMTYLS